MVSRLTYDYLAGSIRQAHNGNYGKTFEGYLQGNEECVRIDMKATKDFHVLLHSRNSWTIVKIAPQRPSFYQHYLPTCHRIQQVLHYTARALRLHNMINGKLLQHLGKECRIFSIPDLFLFTTSSRTCQNGQIYIFS
jgi:hypothetical protein